MGLFSNVKKIFGWQPQKKSPPPPPPLPPSEQEEDEVDVPELTSEALQERLTGSAPPHLLDIREQYEWNQVRIEGIQHIPMNAIPERLDELPREAQIIVFCAHGQRSYGVAHYLIEHGFDAASLAGGVTDWAAKGFEVSVGPVRE